MSVESVVRSVVPAPEFQITGAAHVEFAAAPTMAFTVAVGEQSGRPVRSMALSAQVMIDPARRGYDTETRERLTELFGPPANWTPSTQGLALARLFAQVPAFSGETTFTLELPCTYDLEVAAAKYFYALTGGVVPLSFHWSGTVFYRDHVGRLQVAPVPWSASSQFGLPVSTWRAMIGEHYPGGGWIRLSDDTLAALQARRAARGLHSFDACIAELLDDAR
jgi:Family of unknown function (DUF6084)